jgi:signal transduction histidine kinase
MRNSVDIELAEKWQQQRSNIEASLQQAFMQHAIDNSGLLTSARRGTLVADQLYELMLNFIVGKAGEAAVTAVAEQLAGQGMAMVTGGQMMRSLAQAHWLETAEPEVKAALLHKLADFQLLFMEKLARAREVIYQRRQESSQDALQQALHTQLEQQRHLRRTQEQWNQSINEILQLNARLARTTDESELLDEAVNGICQALNLADVTIYELHIPEQHWAVRTTTAAGRKPGHAIPAATLQLLDKVLGNDDEIISRYQSEKGENVLSMTLALRVGKKLLGAMIANSSGLKMGGYEGFPILLRTFAQNLAALWRNLFLLTETRQRAHELEILHGRYVDNIWNTETAALHATYSEDGLQIVRKLSKSSDDNQGRSIPLLVGGHSFGYIRLPDDVTLTHEETEFTQAVIREMASALNNAHLLQATRSYSTQLSVAAEVSRAATTILDRDRVIQEMVELIRDRFGLYYVGFYLIDEQNETAVLKAGTGNAGQLQLEQGHKHIIGGKSMVSHAIVSGQARLEQDVTQTEAFSHNPLLPHTRSELALPLRSRDRTIGALTVQSTEIAVFNSETMTVMQSLADQLAVTIENATLFAQVQTNLAETSRLYETSRRMSEARDQREVYQCLVDFAGQSNLADVVHAIIADPTAPDYFLVPALWSRVNIPYNVTDRFPRNKFQFGEKLTQNQLILLRDAQNDTSVDVFTRRLFKASNLRGSALIPIHLENEWLGTLALHCTEAKLFTNQELQPFLTLADQAAVILANQQLLQQTDSLYHIGRALSHALTREDALGIAVREVVKYTGAAQCRFVLYDKQTGIGTVAAEYLPTTFASTVQLPMLGDFAYEYLSEQRQPLLLEEKRANVPPEAVRRHVLQFGAKASLLIPAASQQELIGFMALDSSREKRLFSQTNIIFAQTVVDHLTTQIENIKLLDEALSRAQELITLNQIQSNISGILDLNGLAKIIYDQVGRLLDNTFFILARYESDTNLYRPILYVNEGQLLAAEPRRLLPGEALYQFLHNGEPLLADPSHPLMREGKTSSLDRAPKSSLWVPLLQEGLATGLICVQSHEARAYNENDRQLLRSIATQTSLAIANAQLFEKTQANVIELSRLFAGIQTANEQLRQLDQLKTQFLANMSHELRTPLNSIIGFSRVILKGIDGPLTTEQEEDLTSIYNNGQHLLMLINEILDMAKIEAGKMALAFEMVNIEDAAQATLSTMRSLIKEDVELLHDLEPELPLIEADPMRVRQILMNLLSNAAKYTDEGSILLQINRDSEARIHIAVRDTGIGIATEDFDKLFKAFEQVDSSTTRAMGGTGLGLPITEWLVTMHQGRIWVESELGMGSTFHVTLPLRQEVNTTELLPDPVTA